MATTKADATATRGDTFSREHCSKLVPAAFSVRAGSAKTPTADSASRSTPITSTAAVSTASTFRA